MEILYFYKNYARKRIVFRKNLHSWHKFYTNVGRDGCDKSQQLKHQSSVPRGCKNSVNWVIFCSNLTECLKVLQLQYKITLGVCKSCTSKKIMQESALFSGKIYTAGTNFTRPPVATVVTNLNLARQFCSEGLQKILLCTCKACNSFRTHWRQNLLCTSTGWLSICLECRVLLDMVFVKPTTDGPSFAKYQL